MEKFLVIYDFDGTLTKPPLPKYLFIENVGYPNGTQGEKFLDEMKIIQQKTGQETMVVYIDLMMKIIKENGLKPTLQMLYKGQDTLQYNKGIDTFFDTLVALAKHNKLELKNYIVTGGFADYLQNLYLARYFEKIFGAEFDVDKSGDILGVKKVMLNSMKIDAIKEIIKSNGQLETDCKNVVYIGDGLTDKFAMEYIHNNGGKTIFVHHGNLDIYNEVNKNGIVDYCLEADYRENSDIVKTISAIMK